MKTKKPMALKKKVVYEESGKWKSGLKLIKSVIKRRSMKEPMAFLLGAELSNVLEVTHILTRSQTNVRLSHSCRNKHSHLRILKNPKQTLKKNESMVFPGFFTKLVRETSQPAATEWNPKLHKWQLLASEASTQVFKLHKLMEIIQHERPILRSLVPAYRYWGSWEAWNISPGQTSGSMREETSQKKVAHLSSTPKPPTRESTKEREAAFVFLVKPVAFSGLVTCFAQSCGNLQGSVPSLPMPPLGLVAGKCR
jgi:hypothetical protein